MSIYRVDIDAMPDRNLRNFAALAVRDLFIRLGIVNLDAQTSRPPHSHPPHSHPPTGEPPPPELI